MKRKSEFKGVYWIEKSGKWAAGIHFDGKPHHLGCFDGELDAALKRDDVVVQENLWRDLNFPERYPNYHKFFRTSAGRG